MLLSQHLRRESGYSEPAFDRRDGEATGKIGGAVAEMLCEGGLEACLIVRHASRAPGWAQDVAVTGYADRATAIEALTGVDILFMVLAAESEDRLEQLSRTLLPVNGATTVSPMTSPAQRPSPWRRRLGLSPR